MLFRSGTKAHIMPKSEKQGHFMRYDDMIFGYKVNHPGTRATNVLRDTVQNHISDIREAQEQYLAEISKTLEEAGMKVDAGEEFEDDD